MQLLNVTRALRTFSAHLFGQAITVLSVVAIPWVCLGHWSAADFGIWIIAAALSQFFLVSDFGLSSAVANHLCLDDKITPTQAWGIISETFRLILKRILMALLLATLMALTWHQLTTRIIDPQNGIFVAPIIFFLLSIQASTQPIVGLFCAVMRYRDNNGIGIFVANVGRLVELLALTLAVVQGAGLVNTALSIVIAKFAIVIVLTYSTVRMAASEVGRDEITINACQVSPAVERAGIGIAANFFALNLLLHGLVLVASFSSTVAAAIFSSTRTVTRLPLQPLGIIFQSIGPEISEIFKRKDMVSFKRVTGLMLLGTLSFTIMILGLTVAFRLELEQLWLHGKVPIPQDLLLTMGVGMMAHISWQSGAQVLTAINQTFKVGMTYLGIGAVTVGMAFIAQYGYGLVGVSIVWAIAEFLMCFVVWSRLSSVYKHNAHWGQH